MPEIGVITLFPEMIQEAVRHGLLGQALEKKLLAVQVLNPREFSQDKHRTVDDRPFGGGDGMVMMAEPLKMAIEKNPTAYVIYLSPQGAPFTTVKAQELSQKENLVLVCGRYGGIDQRVINQYIHEEISIGDYVLCGGELAALVVIEALARFIPGVLGHEDSAAKDSFGDGLLEQPHFTRPRDFDGSEVPAILLSGHHAQIEAWKKQVSLLVTYKKRPDLFLRYIKLQNKSSLSASTKKKKSDLSLTEFYKKLSPNDRKVLNLEEVDLENLSAIENGQTGDPHE